MTTIKLKNGSGAPTAGDLAQGEPALDLTNKRLYTEDSGGTVIEVGTNPGASGAVTLNHSGNAKLATTSTGIDVTGTVTADGLTVDSTLATINSSGPNVDLVLTESSTNTDARIRNSNGILEIDADLNNEFGNSSMVFAVDGTDKLHINNNGDISFYDAAGTDAKLFWDASVESLGIGTSSPEEALHVSGSFGDAITSKFENTGSALSYIEFENSAASGALIGARGQRLSFLPNGTETMVIDSSGNVGIGESSPFDKLVVRSSDANSVQSALSLKNGDIGTSAGVALNFVVDDNNDVITSAIYGQRTASAYHQGSLQFLTRDSGGAGLTERMRIDSSGVVSIKNEAAPTLRIENTDTSLTANQTIGDIDFYQNDPSGTGAGVVSKIRSINSSSFQGEAGLAFHTGTTSGLTEAMRIDVSGNVGIGTSSPSAKLHIEGSTPVLRLRTTADTEDSLIHFADTSSNFAGVIAYSHNGNDMKFYTNQNERMRIDSSGNLLVGTTDANVTNNTGNNPGINIGVAGIKGLMAAARYQGPPLALNRLNNDGSIAEFSKDGTTVGSIGVRYSNLYTGRGNSGLAFSETGLDVHPFNPSTLNDSDAQIDLGISTSRFKDLYLSGGIDISQGTEPQTAFIDINQTILDDAVYSFTPDRSIGVMYIYGRNANYDEVFGIVNYRAVSAAFCTQQLDPSSVISTSTSVLTGTTGTDGQITISAVPSDGKIYIENRLGKVISIGIHVTGQ